MNDDDDRYDPRIDDQDDGLDENGNFKFECPRYFIKGEGWYCPLIGTEECDWDCPE
jgi:hypothetical protein